MIADATILHNEPIAFANSPLSSTKLSSASFASHSDAAPTASINGQAAGSDAPIKPVLVRTISYRTVPVQTASLAPMPMLVPIVPAAPPLAAAQPRVQSPSPAAATEQRPTVVASAAPTTDLTISAPAAAQAAPAPPAKPVPITIAPPAPAKPTPITIAPAAPAQIPAPVVARTDQAPLEADRAEIADAQPAKLETAIPSEPIHAHGGWLIQIGAFDDENDAKQHLSNAQLKLHVALASKDPFTERVQKGDKALYRARFAGFEKQASAEAACRELKRSDFQCMALKD
jgi:hypothetical protein